MRMLSHLEISPLPLPLNNLHDQKGQDQCSNQRIEEPPAIFLVLLVVIVIPLLDILAVILGIFGDIRICFSPQDFVERHLLFFDKTQNQKTDCRAYKIPQEVSYRSQNDTNDSKANEFCRQQHFFVNRMNKFQ